MLAVTRVYGLCDVEVVADSNLPGLRSRDFLWRVWGIRMGFDSLPADPVKAQLRASQKFISFLRLTWLAALYKARDYDGGASLFRAEDFFLHVVEADAYNHHILQR